MTSRDFAIRFHTSRSERGSVALFMALFTVGMLAMAGLVVDGGTALATRGRAHDIAQQAARAGADALSPASLRGLSPAALRIDPVEAQSAAQRYLSAAGATGSVSVKQDSVTVTAHIRAHATILSAFGVSDLSGHGEATATIVHGV
jgi:Flp pilus assembly protein TadG